MSYHEWTKPVREIYDEALRRLNGNVMPLHYGPAHVVWEDENFQMAKWCLDLFDEFEGEFSSDQLDVVRWSLKELLKAMK